MPYHVTLHPHASAFLQSAGAWLMQREAEHNLVLGLARAARTAAQPDALWATVENAAGAVAGCAFRTPPHKLGLTRLPPEAVPALADAVATRYDALPQVMGPEPAAGLFAAAWARRGGSPARPDQLHRLYALDKVVWPQPLAPGRLRLVQPTDALLAVAWARAFAEESGAFVPSPELLVAAYLDRQALFFWEHDDEPVAMVGWTGRTPHTVRVGYVYTLPEQRRRGYAAAAVATLSHELLAAGFTTCVLYADAHNAASNALYQRLGYRPLGDVMNYAFAAPG